MIIHRKMISGELLCYWFLFVWCGSIVLYAEGLASIQWQRAYVKNDVEVFHDHNTQKGILGMRGKTILNAPPQKVLSILLEPDYEKRKDWFENLLEYRLVKQTTPLKRILYITVDVPWPLADRDFVYSATLSRDPMKKTIVLSYQSLNNIVSKQKSAIRGYMESVFTLKSIENGEKTVLDVQSFVDPKGIIPKNIVNMVQKDFAYDMLFNLRNLSEKPEIVVLNEFKDIMGAGVVD